MPDSYKGRLKMFCRLLILVFFCSLFSTPTVSHVIQKRAAFYIANETMCIVDGDVYRNGDPVPTDDECERCTCRPPGFSCVLRDCDTKPGCKAVRRVGECCPEYVCGCVHNSRLYEDGELIKDLQNNCYTCRCHGSSISCVFADCHFRSDCPPEYIPGECCPRYDHCPFESPTTSTTTTTTPSPSSHLVQEEIDFFNLTTKHLQKFTTEGTTAKVEDIKITAFTTPASTYSIKFSLSGGKISSIHDFSVEELTTLLPLQPVTYKETTRHLDIEMTTIKDGLIISSFDKTTESPSTFESEAETGEHLKTSTDAEVLSNKMSTDIFSGTSKISFTEKDAITLLTDDVSDWEDESKNAQEAESSTFESDSEEEIIAHFDEQEITQEESSHAQTEIPISSHTLEDFDHGVILEELSTAEYSEKTHHENIHTQSIKSSLADLLSTTTIDDETVTRKMYESTHDDIESSFDDLLSNTNASSTQTSEEIATSSKNIITAHTEPDSNFTTLITKLAHSSTTTAPSFDTEKEVSTLSKTNASPDDMNFASNNSTADDHKITDTYKPGETSTTSLFEDEYSTESKISASEDRHTTYHYIYDILESSTYNQVESSSEQPDVITDSVQTQTPFNSSGMTDTDESFDVYHTEIEKETPIDIQTTDMNTTFNELKSSTDSLLTTSHYSESPIYSSYPEHSSSYDVEGAINPEHDKEISSAYSTEISTVTSIVKDITASSKPVVDEYNHSTILTIDSEHIHKSSTEYSEIGDIDTTETDEKYDTTIIFEKIDHDSNKETTKEFEKDKYLNKTDLDLVSVEESEEIEGESEEMTTKPSGPTISDHITTEETLDLQDTKINIHMKQTNEGKNATETVMEMTDIVNNIDYNTTDEVVPKEYTPVVSVSSSESLTNAEVTELDIKENTSQHIISKTDSFTDVLIYITTTTPKPDKPSSLTPSLLETTPNKIITNDKQDEIISGKQDTEVSTTQDATYTQTPKFIKTTFEAHITEKTSTTTEDDMPNELPAFEPPLANILKQHMMFNRPVPQTGPSSTQNAKSNTSKDNADENQIEKLPLTVEETDKDSSDSSDLDELENKIFSLNQEYTIQNSEILSTIEIPNNESPNVHDSNKDNLYFVEHGEATQSPSDHLTSTQVILNVQSTSKIEDLTSTQDYSEYLTTNIEIMDSEEHHKPIISKEKDGEDMSTNDPVTLYETNTSFNIFKSDTENTTGTNEIIISLTNNSDTNAVFTEESHIQSGVTKIDSLLKYAPTTSIDFSDDSTVVDSITTQGHLTENVELSTIGTYNSTNLRDEVLNKDLISSETSDGQEEVHKSSQLEDNIHENYSDFVYEDAESSENFDDRTSTAIEELQTHLITPEKATISSSLSDNDETSTKSRPISSGMDYTPITSDSAKEEYLAALKFSTLYGQKFFTTSQHYYPPVTNVSLEIENISGSTTSSVIDEANNKEITSNFSESTQYTDKQQSHDYNEERLATAINENLENAPDLVSPLAVTFTEDENLSASKEQSDTLKSLGNSFSTFRYFEHLLDETNFSTNQELTVTTTESDFETPVDQNEFKNHSFDTTSTGRKNSTVSWEQNYSSRLKNEFAEYGVLGGVFITGKSKYKKNNTHLFDKKLNDTLQPEFLKEEMEKEINPVTESKDIDLFNESDDLEIENDAEADYFSTHSGLNTKYATKNIFENEEETEHSAIINENQEASEMEVMDKISTDTSTDVIKLKENFQTDSETTAIINNLTNSDEALSVTTMNVGISEIPIEQTYYEGGNEDSFLTKIEIEQEHEHGPEKDGDWFEPTDPSLILANVDRKENVSDIESHHDNSEIIIDLNTESNTEHGPEKGGEWFEPTDPSLIFATFEKKEIISNITPQQDNSDTIPVVDTANHTEHGPEKGGEWFEPTDPNLIFASEDMKANTSNITSQHDNSDIIPNVNTESDTEFGPEKEGKIFKSTFPAFPQYNAYSHENHNQRYPMHRADESTSTKFDDLNNENISNENISNENVASITESSGIDSSTESNIKLDFVPPLPIWFKNAPPKHLKTSNDTSKSNLTDEEFGKLLNSTTLDEDYMSDVGKFEPPQKIPPNEGKVELPLKLPSERNLNPSYDLSGIISKVFKAPGYDAEVHLRSLNDYPDLKKQQFLRLKRDTNLQSETTEIIQLDNTKSKNKLPSGSGEDVNLFKNKNILRVEGYGHKQDGYFPITSSLIIVHSDEENEAKVDFKQNKSENQSQDTLVSDFLDEIMSTNPEKDYKSSNSHKNHPKV